MDHDTELGFKLSIQSTQLTSGLAEIDHILGLEVTFAVLQARTCC